MSLTSLSALASVSGFVKGNPTDTIVAVPAGAIAQRNGDYILDRADNYIEVRA